MFAKKSLGQNFLTSKKALREIIEASEVASKDTVLEIGPGKGVLTQKLLETGAKVIAVEKDERLIPFLEDLFTDQIRNGQFILIAGDITEMSAHDILKGQTPFHVVANIPYYITGLIIRTFLEDVYQPKSMTLLVQKEVAERIIARDKKESLLSISVKIFGTPKLISIVKRGAFTPSPNVDSAIIHISNISKEKLQDITSVHFFEVLKIGFAHKRKQLFGNLAVKYSKNTLTSVFENLSLSLKIRAEDLSLSDWISLSQRLL